MLINVDVVMVWHAYMLNPRCFLEDCYRLGKLDFFATPFPWAAIDSCIDPDTFAFNASAEARKAFEGTVDLKWDNVDDAPHKTIICPMCESANNAEWSIDSSWNAEMSQMNPGSGLADSEFHKNCDHCSFQIDHDSLRAQKFRNDVERLLQKGLPMPGTVLAPQGQPREHALM